MSSIAMKHRSTLVSLITFLSVVVLVQLIWGWSTLLSFWKLIPLHFLLLFSIMYWLSYLVRGYRISIYFRKPNIKLPMKIVFPLVVKQTFWANILPAKAGEISFPILMKRSFDTPYNQSVPALLVLRLFDAYVLASIAVALFTYSKIGNWIYLWLGLSFFIPLVGISLKRVFIGITYKLRAKSYAKFCWRILTNIPSTRKKLLSITALSWLNWGLKIVLFASLLANMTSLNFSQTTLAALLGEISGMLPGLPGGFGSYEAAISFGLMPHSSANDLSTSNIVAAALNSHFFILFNSIFGAMILFLRPRKTTVESNL